MSRILAASKIAALASVVFLFADIGVTISRIPRILDTHLSSIEGQVLSRVDAAARAGTHRLDAELELLNGHVDTLHRVIVLSALRTSASASGALYDATGALTGVRTDLQPVTLQAASTLTDLDTLVKSTKPMIDGGNLLMARNALPAQLLGLTAAAKVTLGESAQTMRELQRAAPVLIDGTRQIVANSDATTAQGARLMKNLADATKPLPPWVRWIAPASSAGASVVGMGAAAGLFR